MADIECSYPAPGVALLRLDRPEARNALSVAVRRELAGHLERLTDETAVRVVVLTGSEKVFASGADIRELAEASPTDAVFEGLQTMARAVRACPKPIISAVRGYCLGGGCELALMTDVVIVGENAVLGQPEVKVGVIPGSGGIQRLQRAVGKFRAMQMTLTGDPVDGRTAAAIGMASQAVPDETVLDRAIEIASTIASRPALAVRQIKESMLAGADAPLETALALDRKALQMLYGSPDQREGMRAFLERRPPVFGDD